MIRLSLVQWIIVGASAVGWAGFLWIVVFEPLIEHIAWRWRTRKLARQVEIPTGQERL